MNWSNKYAVRGRIAWCILAPVIAAIVAALVALAIHQWMLVATILGAVGGILAILWATEEVTR